MTHDLRRNEISIMRIATLPTAKRLFVSLSPLDESATGTRCAGVGRIHHGYRYAQQGSQQRHTRAEVPRRMLFPSDEPTRVFNCHASSRALSHGHNAAGLMGEQLPLGTGFNLTVDAALLVHRAPVALSFQDRSQVWSLVTIGAGNAGPYTDITADPFSHRLFVGQGNLDPGSAVPLPVLSEDFALLTERCARIGQGAVNRPVFLGRDIELAHALDHDPQVKPLGSPWGLDVRRVNQFGTQGRDDERLACDTGSFLAPLVVRPRPPIGPSGELALTATCREPLRVHGLMYGIGGQATEHPRQE